MGHRRTSTHMSEWNIEYVCYVIWLIEVEKKKQKVNEDDGSVECRLGHISSIYFCEQRESSS